MSVEERVQKLGKHRYLTKSFTLEHFRAAVRANMEDALKSWVDVDTVKEGTYYYSLDPKSTSKLPKDVDSPEVLLKRKEGRIKRTWAKSRPEEDKPFGTPITRAEMFAKIEERYGIPNPCKKPTILYKPDLIDDFEVIEGDHWLMAAAYEAEKMFNGPDAVKEDSFEDLVR